MSRTFPRIHVYLVLSFSQLLSIGDIEMFLVRLAAKETFPFNI